MLEGIHWPKLLESAPLKIILDIYLELYDWGFKVFVLMEIKVGTMWGPKWKSGPTWMETTKESK